MPKVLYVAHNHVTTRPGGMEMYSDELYRAMLDAGDFEPTFVSRVGPPHSTDIARQASRLAAGDLDPKLYYFHTEFGDFDTVLWAARRKTIYTEDWRSFLRAHEPDVVHFHHSVMLGYDMLTETRRTLPGAPIVYHLHEFLPICHHDGQLVRTADNGLCSHPSPRSCHQCYPDIPAQTFFLRERFIKSAFEQVDMFIAPSEQLRRRYMDWGLSPDKIRTENYGRTLITPLPDPSDAGRRKRIGFFGRLTRYKGAEVLLEAMRILSVDDPDIQLVLWGANLDLQRADFRQLVASKLDALAGSVRFAGSYDPDALPALMSAVDWVVVPSIWWENSPLVIQEAMMFRRPVICSGIGGMAENVTDGVNGLHFRVGDPDSLADTIRRATGTPELWDELRAQISDPHPMDQHVKFITRLYRELLDRLARRAA